MKNRAPGRGRPKYLCDQTCPKSRMLKAGPGQGPRGHPGRHTGLKGISSEAAPVFFGWPDYRGTAKKSTRVHSPALIVIYFGDPA